MVDIHPQDAKKECINPNDLIMIITPNGSIQMRVRINSIIPPGTLRIDWGWGEYLESYNMNILTDDNFKDPVTSTTSNRQFHCTIKKINHI
jgi:anaerobic selenocysteine-containing dehydrogenase